MSRDTEVRRAYARQIDSLNLDLAKARAEIEQCRRWIKHHGKCERDTADEGFLCQECLYCRIAGHGLPETTKDAPQRGDCGRCPNGTGHEHYVDCAAPDCLPEPDHCPHGVPYTDDEDGICNLCDPPLTEQDARCPVQKMGEYNTLRCVREAGHSGDHNYAVYRGETEKGND